MNGWYRIPKAAEYAGVSSKTLRHWLKGGLKHARIKGIILLRSEWIDGFIEKYAESSNQAEIIASELVRKVRG